MLEDTANYATHLPYTLYVAGRLWSRWQHLAHRAAEIQSLVVLALLYWIVVVPIGMLRRFWRRPDRRPEWMVRPPADQVSMETARRQF
jgi:hypothetical protein